VACHETANAPRPGAAIPVADRQSDRISPRVVDNAISMLRANDGSMAEAKTKKGLISHGIAAQNRKARFNYAIKDTVEAGLVLKGPEVKSLRHGRATLSEAWAGERDGELWLFNAYIPEYQGGVLSRFEPRAPRKLLLKRKQIRSLAGAVARDGVSLVPLQIHFNDRGRAKVLLGLGEGRKKQDKRAAIAARDWQRDKARLMRARG
jgi:SsrA-binding protein